MKFLMFFSLLFMSVCSFHAFSYNMEISQVQVLTQSEFDGLNVLPAISEGNDLLFVGSEKFIHTEFNYKKIKAKEINVFVHNRVKRSHLGKYAYFLQPRWSV